MTPSCLVLNPRDPWGEFPLMPLLTGFHHNFLFVISMSTVKPNQAHVVCPFTTRRCIVQVLSILLEIIIFLLFFQVFESIHKD